MSKTSNQFFITKLENEIQALKGDLPKVKCLISKLTIQSAITVREQQIEELKEEHIFY